MSFNFAETAVALSACETYDIDALKNIFHKHFQELGIYKQIRQGIKALIKPNLIMKSKPDEAIITHPNVVAAAGLCLKEAGAEILIAESPGGPYTTGMMKSVFAGCGYTEMAKKYGFALYMECESKDIFLPEGKRCKTLEIVNPFLEADFIVNIAKLKTHGMMGMSGAVKNLFGAVPGLKKPELHCRFPQQQEFAEMIVDICDFLKPKLNIIDAVYGMQGDGPTGGESRFVGAVITSQSPYAADMAAAEIIGKKPEDFFIMKECIERGLVPKSVKDLQILGDAVEKFVVADYKQAKVSSLDFVDRAPKIFRPMLKRLTTPYPKIRLKECIGCGKCAESCPQKVIKMAERKAIIEYASCIKCFCCHEMCPEHVIDIKRWGVFNF